MRTHKDAEVPSPTPLTDLYNRLKTQVPFPGDHQEQVAIEEAWSEDWAQNGDNVASVGNDKTTKDTT